MFEVLGYIFAAIIIIYAVVHAAMAVTNLFKDEEDQLDDISVTNAVFADTYMMEWHIIPTIKLYFGKYFTVTFSWLIFHWEISFHIETRKEVDEKAIIKRKDD